MLRRRMALVLMMAAVIGAFWLVEALCQEEPAAEERPAARARERGDRTQRMEQARRRAAEQMRRQLGASEDEWKNVLQPRIEKVQQLQRQTRVGLTWGRAGARGRGRERPAAEGQPPAGERAGRGPRREQSEVQKQAAALRTLLANEASGEADIKAGLDGLRKAREKAEQELAAARKELRAAVNVRQEAQLVLRGILQ